MRFCDQPFGLLGGEPDGRAAQPLAELELARDDGAARARDDVRPHLRHPPLGEAGKALVEGTRDRELQHRVAEELEPLVRGAAVGRPGGVSEDRRRPVGWERVDQLPESSWSYWCEVT